MILCFSVTLTQICSHNQERKKNKSLKNLLTQLVTEATRVTETSRSLLDVILVNNDHRITDSGVVPVLLSDHYLVYCILKSGVIKAPPKTTEYHSYKNFDVNTFLADLNSVPWHIIENKEDIDDAVFIWNQLFSEILANKISAAAMFLIRSPMKLQSFSLHEVDEYSSICFL